MNNPIKWVPLLNKVYNGEIVQCPYCGSAKVVHQFYSDNQVGCAQFKCEGCGEEAHLSRIKFPEYVKTKSLY